MKEEPLRTAGNAPASPRTISLRLVLSSPRRPGRGPWADVNGAGLRPRECGRDPGTCFLGAHGKASTEMSDGVSPRLTGTFGLAQAHRPFRAPNMVPSPGTAQPLGPRLHISVKFPAGGPSPAETPCTGLQAPRSPQKRDSGSRSLLGPAAVHSSAPSETPEAPGDAEGTAGRCSGRGSRGRHPKEQRQVDRRWLGLNVELQAGHQDEKPCGYSRSD